MVGPQDEPRAPVKTPSRRERWLPMLEEELKRRVGWADEAVSPFARNSRAFQASTDLPHAA